MRRALLLLVLAVLVAVPVGWQAATAYQERHLRPVTGTLTSSVPAQDFGLGSFLVRWVGDGVQVLHPDTAVFPFYTNHGQAFVGVGQGEADITEVRGSFFIDEQRLITCAEQTVTAVGRNQNEASVDITGEVICDNGERHPYTLTFTAVGQNQLHFDLMTEWTAANRTYLTYGTNPGERFFGFGMQFSHFDLRGQRVPIFVSEQGIGRGAEPITTGANIQAQAGGDWYTSYAPVPHYLTSDLRSLFLDTYEYAVFDLRAPHFAQIELFAPRLSGQILAGDSPTDLITQYTAVVGRMRPLPEWATSGAIVGLQGGTKKVRTVWQQLQEHDTPLAGFWLQDWVGQRTTSFGQQLWWNWELDRDRYPGWDTLVQDLNQEGVEVLTYVNPFLTDVSAKENHRRNLFAEARDKGYFVRNEAGEPYETLNTDFTAALLDLTNPEARAWFKEVLRDEVVAVGARGWMADFGEALPTDARLHSGESAASYHNRYPEAWAELNREMLNELPDGEAYLFFTRSGYRGSPASSTLFWLGDQLVSWDEHDGLKTAVVGLLSSGVSGFAFNHSDIGGYTTITSPIADYHRREELLLRWMELNAFTAVFRSHEGNQPANNVQIYDNERTLRHFARMAQVYEAWGFYRQQLVQEAAETGLPVVRHPFLHYPEDTAVYTLAHQQFMVGSELMIAPVLDEGATTVRLYLPAGEWVNAWTGEILTGRQSHVVAAPLGFPAVFYPSGSAVGQQLRANLQAQNLAHTPEMTP